MKKISMLAAILIGFLLLAGCNRIETQKENSVLEESGIEAKSEGLINMKKETQSVDTDQIDIKEQEIMDITGFSKSMAFAEVSNIYITPEDYIGKTLKMKGTFKYFQALDKSTQPIPGKYYFMIIIADTMGCCGVAMEFIPKEPYIFPDDFPNQEEVIKVSGVIKKEKNEHGEEKIRLTEAVIEATNEG